MRKFIAFACLLLFLPFCLAAKQKATSKHKKQLITRNASFTGGEMRMYQFISRNIKYPDFARESDIEGNVVLRFIIDEQGKTTQVTILRSLTQTCDNEAVRVVKAMPPWQPALYKSKPVKSVYELPIVFKME